MRPLLVTILMLCACGNKDADPSQPVAQAPTAAGAGRVVEITGNVTATRDTQVRKLVVADPVAAEDVIDTGTDGSVVIELAHNNARWSLEAGIKSRVDESVAWGLPKQDAANVVDHATSAAGRHADRQAADTSASAAAAAPSTDTKPDPAPVTGTPSPTPTTTPKPNVTAVPPPPPPRRAVATPKDVSPAKAEKPTSIELDGRQKSPSSPGAPSSDVPESLDRQSILTAMRGIKDKLGSCNKAESHGTLKLVIKVSADGSVTSVEVKQSVETALDSCVVGLAKGLKFNRSQNGGTFSYPLVF